MQFGLDLAGLATREFVFETVTLRPSAVSKSATTALISGLDPGSVLAVARAVPPAKLSLRRPERPLGSAAVTAIPATITLSRRSFNSSAVKFDLSGTGGTPPLTPLSLD